MKPTIAIFFEEARENLHWMEQALLAPVASQDVSEQLDAVFRRAHSLKGGAAAFALDDVVGLTHLLESALARLRARGSALETGTVDILLQAVDAVRVLLLQHETGAGRQAHDVVMGRLRQLAIVQSSAPAARSLEILVGPLDRPEQVDTLMELFRDIPGLGTMEVLDSDDVRVRRFAARTPASEQELLDLFSFHVERAIVTIRARAPNFPDEPVELSDGSETGPGVQATERAPEVALALSGDPGLVRVAVDKLDAAMGIADGMNLQLPILAQASEALSATEHAALRDALADFAQRTVALKQSLVSMRMAPVALVFDRFPRLVRDLGTKLGKQFRLKRIGESLELDRAILDRLTDPLIHLVRNGCDHGIEMPAERSAAGKAPAGTITLSASAGAGRVCISVEDDGRGLDRNDLLRSARARGMPAADGLSDDEVWQLVFIPGLSTVESVTDMSGRGVGLDVVRRQVINWGGSLELQSSPGQGMRVTMCLPQA